MIIVCTSNLLASLSSEVEKKAYSENIFQDEVWLEIGKEYQVFGISFRDGLSVPWYWVCEDDSDNYPKPHIAGFFNVINNSIPSDWEFCSTNSNMGDCGFFPYKWANDPSFMEKLVDEDQEALAYFHSLKDKLNIAP